MNLSRHHALVATRAPSGPSLLLAVGITAAMLLAAFAAGFRAPRAWWDRGSRPAAERVTYVAPPVAAPRPSPIPLPVPAGPRTVGGGPTTGAASRPSAPAAPTTAAPRIGPAIVPGAASPGAAAPDTGVGARRGPGAAATRPAGGAEAVGPTLGPLRVGAERPAPPPLSRVQKDSAAKAVMRDIFNPAAVAAAVAMAADAKARSEAAARAALARAGAVSGNYGGAKLGLSIGFGGKSKKERERDEAVDADTRARLSAAGDRIARQRADSARRDSLRVAREALRP